MKDFIKILIVVILVLDLFIFLIVAVLKNTLNWITVGILSACIVAVAATIIIAEHYK